MSSLSCWMQYAVFIVVPAIGWRRIITVEGLGGAAHVIQNASGSLLMDGQTDGSNTSNQVGVLATSTCAALNEMPCMQHSRPGLETCTLGLCVWCQSLMG